jgi:glycosyltransferase involved in cell wall biosynthesis
MAERVTVVIPTFNSGRYLDECLRALREQDYPQNRVEVVIADAGSTDGTLEIARSHGVDRIVDNPLRTGEAGKAAGIRAAGGDLIAFVDSDNVVVGEDWLARMTEPFADPDVMGAEPRRWHHRREDHYINRWHALAGVADPLTLYVGNYCRESLVTNTWTGYPHRSERRDGWEKVSLDPRWVPVLGANGFVVRAAVLSEVDIGDYLFDLDAVYEAVQRGHREVALVDVPVRHYFCDGLAGFRHKTRRRGDDFLYFRSRGQRTYPWGGRQRRGMVDFVFSTVLVAPVLLDAVRGWRRKPDPAWAFHPVACWLTLAIYTMAVVRARVRPQAMSREGWRQ